MVNKTSDEATSYAHAPFALKAKGQQRAATLDLFFFLI